MIKPLRPLHEHHHTEIFELVDEKGIEFRGKWVSEPGTHKVMKVAKLDLEREANALSRLVHPGIPRCYVDEDYFTFTPNNSRWELYCLVMEKIEGQNLQQWIEEHSPISQSLALDWLKQLVRILDHVHRSGFFHQDIKPANIMLRPNGQLALIDFGGTQAIDDAYLARVATSGEEEEWKITKVLTYGYAPQEQIDGHAIPQSDFYALGLTFVHLMTGVSPLNLSKDKQTLKRHWKNKAPQIERPLADLIDALMAPFPGERPQNTQVILQWLNDSLLPFLTKPNRYSFSMESATPAEMELTVTIKINSLPAWVTTLEDSRKQFNVEAKGRLFTVIVKPKEFHKLEQAKENHSHWVATIAGKKWERDFRGNCFTLTDPRIRVIEQKPKQQKASEN